MLWIELWLVVMVELQPMAISEKYRNSVSLHVSVNTLLWILQLYAIIRTLSFLRNVCYVPSYVDFLGQ